MDEAIAIAHEFVDAGSAAVAAGYSYAPRPASLFHFTDAHGLVGILTGRSLWASLATGLNDDSEIRYAVTRSVQLLRSGSPDGVDPEFLNAVAEDLSTASHLADRRIDADAYLISFCASSERSVHWLHYGRSGTGCAIGFNPDRLSGPPFDLAPVIYAESDQERFLGSIVESVWTVVTKYGINSRDSSQKRMLYRMAHHATAARIRTAAPMLKDHAFANEEEWRLITHDVRIDGKESRHGVPLAIEFRVTAGRLVPYFGHKVPDDSITSLVLGASSPIVEGDSALAILLRESGAKPVPISRSSVPVRP